MNRVKSISIISVVFLLFLFMTTLLPPVHAADDTVQAAQTALATQTTEQAKDTSSVGLKALAVGIAIGLAAAGGAVGMGIVGGKAADGISRQPDMEEKIRTTLMLDLVFIETAIIYALLVVILVIFVL
ncbi:MAG: ATP synthase F0 subunit C [Pygmaiobacter massiliensis]|nr:ATP synthase F0 subunit C [Pygmaiobacter massiliensis]